MGILPMIPRVHPPGSPCHLKLPRSNDRAEQPVVTQAIAHWDRVTGHADQLGHVSIQIRDLPRDFLGFASSALVWMDADAAGYGWSINGSAGSGNMDLLSTVTHELGHVLGYGHDHAEAVMGATLRAGHIPGMDHDVLDSALRVGERNLPAMASLPGDVNRDGVFDRFDVVQALQAGKYLSGDTANWSEGDWNDDGRFDQLDIVRALQGGGYRHVDAESDAVFAELG